MEMVVMGQEVTPAHSSAGEVWPQTGGGVTREPQLWKRQIFETNPMTWSMAAAWHGCRPPHGA